MPGFRWNSKIPNWPADGWMRWHGRGGEYLTENHWCTAIPFCWQKLSRCCCCCCCLILNVLGCWMTKMIQLSRCCCLILNVIGCWMTKMIQLSRQTDSVNKWFGRRENSLGCSSVALNRSSEACSSRKQVYLKTPRHVTHWIILNGWSDMAVITGLATTTPGFPSLAPPLPSFPTWYPPRPASAPAPTVAIGWISDGGTPDSSPDRSLHCRRGCMITKGEGCRCRCRLREWLALRPLSLSVMCQSLPG